MNVNQNESSQLAFKNLLRAFDSQCSVYGGAQSEDNDETLKDDQLVNELKMFYGKKINDDTFEIYDHEETTTLELFNCNKLKNVILEKLLTMCRILKCNSLESLKISNGGHTSDEVKIILQDCPQLNDIDVNLTYIKLFLVANCPIGNLNFKNLEVCERMTFSNIINANSFDLNIDCGVINVLYLTDVSTVDHIDLSSLKTSKHVYIGMCNSLSKITFNSDVNIDCLVICHCRSLTDVVCKSNDANAEFKYIRNITISQCPLLKAFPYCNHSTALTVRDNCNNFKLLNCPTGPASFQQYVNGEICCPKIDNSSNNKS